MSEHSLWIEALKWIGGIFVTVFSWVVGGMVKKHMKESEETKKDIYLKLELLDKRVDTHDVSRANTEANIMHILKYLEKIDQKLDK